MEIKMKVHLSIDQLILQKIDTVLPLFFDYDRKGWIVESVKELVEEDRKKHIQESEILSSLSHTNSSKRMEINLNSKTFSRLNEMVKRLRTKKKGISRNLLINEAVRRKLENNGLFLISRNRTQNQEEDREDISIIARLDPSFIVKIKKTVEKTRLRKQEYFIHNWISEAITELLNEEIMGVYTINPKIKNSVSIAESQCVYLKISRAMLSEVDALVQKIKRTAPSFSRNKLFYDAVRKKIEKETS